MLQLTVIDHMVVWFLTWCHREDIENIGIMELHVIPNVCSEYSEQQIHSIGSTYRDIIRSSWSGSSIRLSLDLFSKMSITKSFEVSF
jgi:hypothetical protein